MFVFFQHPAPPLEDLCVEVEINDEKLTTDGLNSEHRPLQNGLSDHEQVI